MCKSRSQLYQRPFFQLHSCAWCYHYLAHSPHIRALPSQPFLFVLTNQTSFPARTLLVPNVTNAGDVQRICSTVSEAACERWKECCLAANSCCQRQLLAGPFRNGSCSRTWDGWACWGDTESGTDSYVSCPGFLQFTVLSKNDN
ncbi:hypothetical protein ACOMHN_029562 [Nucella lapillus]